MVLNTYKLNDDMTMRAAGFHDHLTSMSEYYGKLADLSFYAIYVN